MEAHRLKNKTSLWVKNSWVDLIFFGFGWIVALVAFVLVDQTELKTHSRNLIIIAILGFSFLHRHLTFPLVYGDSEQFNLRKKSYIGYPIFFLALTLFAIFFVQSPVVQGSQIPPEINIRRGSTQEFRFYEKGKKVEKVTVRFTGREKSPEAVAQSYDRKLAGKLRVVAEDGKLNFQMADPSPRTRFYMGNPRGTPDLKNQLGLQEISGKMFNASRPLLFAMIIVSVLWNIYHTIMQKIGILRIYSRKAGYGRAWVDKALLFSWLIFVILALGNNPEVLKQAARYNPMGRVFSDIAAKIDFLLPLITGISLVIALWLSFLYIREEYLHRERFHWPKNLFVLSIVLLYFAFGYDLLVGYAVFGFSHAIEYLAFVYIYAGKKYKPRPATSSLMARAVVHPAYTMAAYCLLFAGIFIFWRFNSAATLGLWILGSSFLHFLYDGWIWKVRDPQVGKPLGIDYGDSQELQPI